jgi:hypothetical protein
MSRGVGWCISFWLGNNKVQAHLLLYLKFHEIVQTGNHSQFLVEPPPPPPRITQSILPARPCCVLNGSSASSNGLALYCPPPPPATAQFTNPSLWRMFGEKDNTRVESVAGFHGFHLTVRKLTWFPADVTNLWPRSFEPTVFSTWYTSIRMGPVIHSACSLGV